MDLAKEYDWAGIEGLWHCSFSFIDHRDLIRKCFPPFPLLEEHNLICAQRLTITRCVVFAKFP